MYVCRGGRGRLRHLQRILQSRNSVESVTGRFAVRISYLFGSGNSNFNRIGNSLHAVRRNRNFKHYTETNALKHLLVESYDYDNTWSKKFEQDPETKYYHVIDGAEVSGIEEVLHYIRVYSNYAIIIHYIAG